MIDGVVIYFGWLLLCFCFPLCDLSFSTFHFLFLSLKHTHNNITPHHTTLKHQIPVIVFTILDFELWIFTREFDMDWRPSAWFWHLWWSSALYTTVDLIWLVTVPHCVRTPKTIIEHHYMSLLYLLAPLPWVYVRPFMGPIISVEINSFLSFARRVAWKSKHWSGDILHVLFLLSWVVTRVLIYPALLVVFLRMVYIWVHPPFSLIHLPIFFVPVHCYFVYMNLVWTRQLFTPLLKQWFARLKQLVTGKTSFGNKEE